MIKEFDDIPVYEFLEQFVCDALDFDHNLQALPKRRAFFRAWPDLSKDIKPKQKAFVAEPPSGRLTNVECGYPTELIYIPCFIFQKVKVGDASQGAKARMETYACMCKLLALITHYQKSVDCPIKELNPNPIKFSYLCNYLNGYDGIGFTLELTCRKKLLSETEIRTEFSSFFS